MIWLVGDQMFVELAELRKGPVTNAASITQAVPTSAGGFLRKGRMISVSYSRLENGTRESRSTLAYTDDVLDLFAGHWHDLAIAGFDVLRQTQEVVAIHRPLRMNSRVYVLVEVLLSAEGAAAIGTAGMLFFDVTGEGIVVLADVVAVFAGGREHPGAISAREVGRPLMLVERAARMEAPVADGTVVIHGAQGSGNGFRSSSVGCKRTARKVKETEEGRAECVLDSASMTFDLERTAMASTRVNGISGASGRDKTAASPHDIGVGPITPHCPSATRRAPRASSSYALSPRSLIRSNSDSGLPYPISKTGNNARTVFLKVW
ncbi:uncharacterized protein EV422DRAFT_508620 [Fimicolochytrium jonesii]|uniref:uncharacterized protein n=1 Tax=Fimicolochytrium jonesii TaxID=1396493 RepID=UPI0022FDECBD|nr:uncharacterized protein EV422DRAFT_508620 [Fimicolochytrium jonesii]KAI8817782.1 hypothetical protein EV422DRAFT_508620 [Fimicolochytrium jonesii]